MIEIDSPNELRNWFSDKNHIWAEQSIAANLELPDDSDLNKAIVTLEVPEYIGNVTVWGSGTLELIVLDRAAKKEVLFRHREYSSPEELRLLLDEYLRAFSNLLL
jgi:hypothetical protein